MSVGAVKLIVTELELIHSPGPELITGGAGADTLTGLAGADTFVYNSVMDSTLTKSDTITDFQHGVDRIDLSGIDANVNQSGDQSFTFIGSNVFHMVAGELNYINGVLSGDVNGDGSPDFRILLKNAPSLSGADLVL